MRKQTNSAQRIYRACARKYQFEYVNGYRPVEVAGPLAFGSTIHRALEAWWSVPLADRLTAAFEAITAIEMDPVDRVIAEELIRGYHCRWIDYQAEALAVEVEFETNLVNPETGAPSRTWTLAGKIDLVVSRNNQTWIVEHKTSGLDITPGSQYWQALQLDAQISTYFAGAAALGYDPAGCIYDVIAKPCIRPLTATPVENRKYKKNGTLYANQRADDEPLEEYRARLRADISENPDRYYQRGEVFRNANDEREAAFDAWQLSRNIRDSELAHRWPRNPDACFKYNRPCEFWPVCVNECSIDDPIRYRKTETVNEELGGGNGKADNETAATV